LWSHSSFAHLWPTLTAAQGTGTSGLKPAPEDRFVSGNGPGLLMLPAQALEGWPA